MLWGRRKTTEHAAHEPETATDDAPSVDRAPPAVASPTVATPSGWSTVGPDMTVDGDVTTRSPLRVVGAVEGVVICAQDVHVDPGGRVHGSVSGQNVTVRGVVQGHVCAEGRLVIVASGAVNGDVLVRSILVEEGGVLSGRCGMHST